MPKKALTRISEAEIDNSLAELVYLKDGENDALGKLLSRAIRLLKAYRQDRVCHQRHVAASRRLEIVHNSLVGSIRKLERT